jgi:hypothetical protein
MNLIFLDNSIKNVNIFKLFSTCSFITINNFEDNIELLTQLNNTNLTNITNIAIIKDTQLNNNYLIQQIALLMPDINVKVYDLSILAQQQSILSNISSLSTPNNSISDFYFDNIFFKQSIQYIYFYEQLITNNNINYSTYTNILLIDKTVSNYLTFFNSANNFTYPIIYNYNTNSQELINLFTNNFTSINRIAIVSTNNNLFINNSKFFTNNDLLPDTNDYSANIKFIINLINILQIKNIDFLACSTLTDNDWKQYFDILTTYNVIIGASIDKTGNLLYGGNWIMESSNTDVKNIYFNDNIKTYHSTLIANDCIWTIGPNIVINDNEYKISMQSSVVFTSGPFINKLLLIGGINDTQFLNTCVLFDPDTNTWTQKASMTFPRVRHSSIIMSDGRVLVIGGYNNISTLFVSEIYDPNNNTWTQTTNNNMPYYCEIYPQITSFNIVLSNNKVVAYSSFYKNYEIYNPLTNIWTIGTSSPGNYNSIISLPNNKIMFFNYVDLTTAGINTGDVFTLNANNNHAVYDIITNTFTNTSEIIIPNPISENICAYKRFFLFTRSNGKLYVFFEMHSYKYIYFQNYQYAGGYVGYIVYNPNTNNWTFGKYIDASCNIASFTVLKNETLLIQSRFTPLNYIYDIDNDILFSYLSSFSFNTIFDSTTVLNNGDVIICGGLQLFSYLTTNKVYIVTPPTYDPPAPIIITPPIYRTYFFNEPLYFNKSIGLVSKNAIPNIGEYDYIIRLNMSLNDFFTTRTYQQSVSNIDNTIVTFEINQDNFNLAYNNTLMDANRDALIRGIEYTTSCDTRVLEILALKIFGHAKSRSAIKNDTNIISDVKDNLFNFFNNIVQTYKMDIFNQYIQYDLVDINTNDVSTPVNFNFTNDIIDFPGYISGSLLNIGQLSQELLNGPISGNSTSLVNGIYNVPILIKFG